MQFALINVYFTKIAPGLKGENHMTPPNHNFELRDP
jgi:hypothetical protein